MNNLDLTKWVTQQSLANELTAKLGQTITVQRVHNWINRGKIKAQKIEGSRLQLVDRTSINIKTI